MKKTKNELEYQVFTEIDESWDEYDQLVAKGHLERFKKIFMDKHGYVIESENEFQDILENERKERQEKELQEHRHNVTVEFS